MKRLSLKHLSNEAVESELKTKAAREKGATAELLVYIAEFDERKLYLPAAYPSMLAYSVGELGLSKDEAKKRIQVARAARNYPAMLKALAEGRVHLSGLRLLAPQLTPENADELLAAATHKSADEIEKLLAERHPRLDVPAQVVPVPVTPASDEGALGHLPSPEVVANMVSEGATWHPRARVAPLSVEAFAVQFTRSRDADGRFRYLQDLLGHQVARGDLAEVYDRAVKALIKHMEHVRFGACKRPRAGGGRLSNDPRYIPAQVKREVWIRDGGQCTYVSESGHRCEAKGDVEFDHVEEVARGGEATAANLRLRCRGHNQHAAEQTFGAGFMKRKREEAAAARAEKERARAQREAEREASRLRPHQLEVIPWLQQLGCSKEQSRIAVERCREMADAPLEDRVKRALSWFGARCARTILPMTATGASGADSSLVAPTG